MTIIVIITSHNLTATAALLMSATVRVLYTISGLRARARATRELLITLSRHCSTHALPKIHGGD